MAKLPVAAESDAPEAIRLLHELQVHQAELAQQNEELRSARFELESSLAQQLALFEFAPVGLVNVDAAGRILGLNRRAAELLGARAAPGTTLADAVATESRYGLLRALAGGPGAQGTALEVHTLLTAGDGGTRTADVQVCRPRPGTTDLLVALTETTDRGRSERARLAQQRAEGLSREKSVFLARMSHELRTPLNAVLGYAYLLSIEPAVSGSVALAKHVDHIRDAGRHLLSLVDQVLDVSRLEAGGLLLKPEDVDVGALLAEVAAMLQPMAALHAVTLIASPGTGHWGARADRTSLRQVLLNLMSNAIKYNEHGGEVRVRLASEGAELAIAVVDNGPGLTPDQQVRLGQPFERLGAERGAVQGVGLGLTIAQQLVQAMHGRLEVESAAGRGSSFTIRVPRVDLAAASTESTASPTATASSRPQVPPPPGGPLAAPPLRVLYVEDNPVNTEIMSAILAQRPHVQLLAASDGKAGLAVAQSAVPDLVLLDMHLPDMHGLEFHRHLRNHATTADIPCVAVSASAMPQDVRAALDAGLDDYLTKPLDIEALFALVDRTVPRQPRASPGTPSST